MKLKLNSIGYTQESLDFPCQLMSRVVNNFLRVVKMFLDVFESNLVTNLNFKWDHEEWCQIILSSFIKYILYVIPIKTTSSNW